VVPGESWRDSRPYCRQRSCRTLRQPTAASGAFSTRWYIGAFPVGNRAVISGG
jgi:hypothetical protein